MTYKRASLRGGCRHSPTVGWIVGIGGMLFFGGGFIGLLIKLIRNNDDELLPLR